MNAWLGAALVAAYLLFFLAGVGAAWSFRDQIAAWTLRRRGG
jgi:hypothetical protein